MKVLLAGWFSFEEMGATAGDLFVRDTVHGWLHEAGCEVDVAMAPPFTGGVDWQSVEPNGYSHVAFVCGPFGNGPPLTEFLTRFSASDLIGLNLTMLHPIEAWNPFDLLIERDSSRETRPDISFLSGSRSVPVVGVSFVPDQEMRGAANKEANRAIEELLERTEAAVVRIDTRLDVPNAAGLRTPGEVEALIAAVNVMVTTRLHGSVLALKNGVPVVAVDPIRGGHKVRAQLDRVGWPAVFNVDEISAEKLDEAFAYCLTDEASAQASRSADTARDGLADVRERLFKHLHDRGG